MIINLNSLANVCVGNIKVGNFHEKLSIISFLALAKGPVARHI